MCDQDHLAEMGRQAKAHRQSGGLSRRQFAAMGAAATAFALAPLDGVEAQGQPGETNVRFDAPDGRMDALLIYPREGKHPAVIVWPDIAGSRDAPSGSFFTGIGGRSAADLWAVGGRYVDGRLRPMVQHFDGTRWAIVSTPDPVGEPGRVFDSYLGAEDV